MQGEMETPREEDSGEIRREASSTTTGRPRLRIGDLLQRTFDIRSYALSGLFLLALFYTIYFVRS